MENGMQTVIRGASHLEVTPIAYGTWQFSGDWRPVDQQAAVPNFFTGSQTPAGTEVAKSYGEVGHIPDALFTSLTLTFEGKDAPNPHDAAETIVKLIGQAKGSRAVRTVVRAPFGSAKANEDVAPVQAKAVDALGLSHLEKAESQWPIERKGTRHAQSYHCSRSRRVRRCVQLAAGV
jgi:hypothetical protein